MAEIKVSKNKYSDRSIFLIDDEDSIRVCNHKWLVDVSGRKGAEKLYLRSRINKKLIRLHRFIMNAEDPKIQIDHINGDTFDNRKSNLRFATNSQNSKNQGIRKNNTSGFKGVTFDKTKNKWVVQIWKDLKKVYHKRFNTLEEAVNAYNEKSKELFGEFANLNKFPE